MYVHVSRLPLADLRDACLTGAECLHDPELHDGPAPKTSIEPADDRAAREDVAKAICQDCPVRPACLEYALRVRPKRGVWAGLTAEELGRLMALPEQPAGDPRGEVA
jgi:WhiB family transcriptional regulator, redox-sensing transcriptional regulator